MQFSTIALTGLLAAAVSAYEVLTPVLNSTITKGDTINIKWSSVSTDANIFSIYITNFATAHWPPTVVPIAQNVPRDDGSIDIRIPGDLSADYGWQINFINGTNTYVIYAQSPVFELSGPDVPNPVVSTPVCQNPAKETVTVTATVTEGGNHAYPTGGSEGGKPTAYPSGSTGGNGGYQATGCDGVSCPTGEHTAGYAAPTGTGSYVKPSKLPEFTGAGSSVRVGGVAALIVGVVALLL